MAQIGSYNSPIKIDEENNVEIQKDLEVEGDLKANVDLGYKVYTALLNQSGSDAPVSTVLQNTTGATLTWSRVSTGVYELTADSSIFTENKTFALYNLGNTLSYAGINSIWTRVSDTLIRIDIAASSQDVIDNGSFEVRIYN